MGHSATVLITGTASDTAARGYVLHVVPANGGGVDRYVRDICAHRPRDCILHVVQEQCVFEVVAAHRFIPIDRECMTDSSVVDAIGRPSLLHAHSTLAPVRKQVALLSNMLGVEYVLTLHDIDFAGAFGMVDDDERKLRLDFVRMAAQRFVPSAYISALLSTALGAQTTRQLIENGVDAAPAGSGSPVAFNVAGKFQIAVVGALGPHKGLNFLRDVVTALPLELRLIVIGYADGQITPGWLQAERLWVHGAFEPDDLAAIVHGYGVRMAFFPNRQPESYSYALSDVWRAGLPALGPAAGAIGDRIRQTGAGWTYASDSLATVVATTLRESLHATAPRSAQARAAAAALPSTRAMVDRLSQQYEKIMRTRLNCGYANEVSPRMNTLDAVAATQLNGRFFRGELTKLSGDLVFAQTQAANANRALQAVTLDHKGRGVWIAELEASISECRGEIARIEAARLVEHEEAEAARANDRELSEAARRVDREQGEAARRVDREQSEAARRVDREQAEAVRMESLAEQARQAEAARVTAHNAHVADVAKLQKDVNDTLAIAHRQERIIAIYERALSMIPPFVRRRMLARAERLLSVKEAP